MTHAELKSLVESGQWDVIGARYGFTPTWYAHGPFNWASCSPGFWRAYEPRLWPGVVSSEPKWSVPRFNFPPADKFTVMDPVSAVTDPVRAAPWPYIYPRKNGKYTGINPGLRKRQRHYINQSGICHYCHKNVEYGQWTLDHKLPLSKGGNNHPSNLIGCCKRCNNEKGALTEIEYLAVLRTRAETKL